MTSLLPVEAGTDLDRWLGPGAWSATQIAGDASARKYFRVSVGADERYVLAYYPETVRAGISRFLAAYEALRGLVAVPEVLEAGRSTVLQQNVGNLSLSACIEQNRDEALGHYETAADLLNEFAEAQTTAARINPPFDEQKFVEELELSRRYFVEELAGVDSEPLEPLFSRLATRLTEHPYTLCHRDYHGDNLYLYNNLIYIIDYQDLRMGPDMYDLASLLRDRGVWRALGPDFESKMLGHRTDAIGSMFDSVRIRYLEVLLQRSIKAIGTFARLVVVEDRQNYLEYIGSTLETIRECARELEEWRELATMFPFESRRGEGF